MPYLILSFIIHSLCIWYYLNTLTIKYQVNNACVKQKDACVDEVLYLRNFFYNTPSNLIWSQTNISCLLDLWGTILNLRNNTQGGSIAIFRNKRKWSGCRLWHSHKSVLFLSKIQQVVYLHIKTIPRRGSLQDSTKYL